MACLVDVWRWLGWMLAACIYGSLLRSACEVPWVEESSIVFEDSMKYDGAALSIFQGLWSEPGALYGWLYSNTEAAPGKGYGGADVIQLQMLLSPEFVDFQLEGIHLPAGGGSSGRCAAAFPERRICSMQHDLQCKEKKVQNLSAGLLKTKLPQWNRGIVALPPFLCRGLLSSLMVHCKYTAMTQWRTMRTRCDKILWKLKFL